MNVEANLEYWVCNEIYLYVIAEKFSECHDKKVNIKQTTGVWVEIDIVVLCIIFNHKQQLTKDICCVSINLCICSFYVFALLFLLKYLLACPFQNSFENITYLPLYGDFGGWLFLFHLTPENSWAVTILLRILIYLYSLAFWW